jgi:predicted nucleotidyltransferase component of viral defense system
MKGEIRNLPASILARLKTRARDRGQVFNEVLVYYVLERFLYRLSRSKHRDQFVLKGALAMLTWPVAPARATRDIDLRASAPADPQQMMQVFRQVCLQEVEADGVEFDPELMRAEVIVEQARYPGVRVRLEGRIGKARIPFGVEVGPVDPINPAPEEVDYPVLLTFPPPRLAVYPKETIVAEKFEAMVKLGELNSRMKDYFDLRFISNTFTFQGPVLLRAIADTFDKRGTEIPRSIPLGLRPEFAEGKAAEWSTFLRRIRNQDRSLDDFVEVLEALEEFLGPPLAAAARGDELSGTWSPGEGWRPTQ